LHWKVYVPCEVRTLSSPIIYITSELKKLAKTDRLEDYRILKLLSKTLQRANKDRKVKRKILI
jgi:hypothetical protein